MKVVIEKALSGYKLIEEGGIFEKAKERLFSTKKEILQYLDSYL